MEKPHNICQGHADIRNRINTHGARNSTKYGAEALGLIADHTVIEKVHLFSKTLLLNISPFTANKLYYRCSFLPRSVSPEKAQQTKPSVWETL